MVKKILKFAQNTFEKKKKKKKKILLQLVVNKNFETKKYVGNFM